MDFFCTGYNKKEYICVICVPDSKQKSRLISPDQRTKHNILHKKKTCLNNNDNKNNNNEFLNNEKDNNQSLTDLSLVYISL